MISALEQLLLQSLGQTFQSSPGVTVGRETSDATVRVRVTRWQSLATADERPTQRRQAVCLGALLAGERRDDAGRTWWVSGGEGLRVSEVEAPHGRVLREGEDYEIEAKDGGFRVGLYRGGSPELRAWVTGGPAQGYRERTPCVLELSLRARGEDADVANLRMGLALATVLLTLEDAPDLEGEWTTLRTALPVGGGVRARLCRLQAALVGGTRGWDGVATGVEAKVSVFGELELIVARGTPEDTGVIARILGRLKVRPSESWEAFEPPPPQAKRPPEPEARPASAPSAPTLPSAPSAEESARIRAALEAEAARVSQAREEAAQEAAVAALAAATALLERARAQAREAEGRAVELDAKGQEAERRARANLGLRAQIAAHLGASQTLSEDATRAAGRLEDLILDSAEELRLAELARAEAAHWLALLDPGASPAATDADNAAAQALGDARERADAVAAQRGEVQGALARLSAAYTAAKAEQSAEDLRARSIDAVRAALSTALVQVQDASNETIQALAAADHRRVQAQDALAAGDLETARGQTEALVLAIKTVESQVRTTASAADSAASAADTLGTLLAEEAAGAVAAANAQINAEAAAQALATAQSIAGGAAEEVRRLRILAVEQAEATLAAVTALLRAAAERASLNADPGLSAAEATALQAQADQELSALAAAVADSDTYYFITKQYISNIETSAATAVNRLQAAQDDLSLAQGASTDASALLARAQSAAGGVTPSASEEGRALVASVAEADAWRKKASDQVDTAGLAAAGVRPAVTDCVQVAARADALAGGRAALSRPAEGASASLATLLSSARAESVLAQAAASRAITGTEEAAGRSDREQARRALAQALVEISASITASGRARTAAAQAREQASALAAARRGWEDNARGLRACADDARALEEAAERSARDTDDAATLARSAREAAQAAAAAVLSQARTWLATLPRPVASEGVSPLQYIGDSAAKDLANQGYFTPPVTTLAQIAALTDATIDAPTGISSTNRSNIKKGRTLAAAALATQPSTLLPRAVLARTYTDLAARSRDDLIALSLTEGATDSAELRAAVDALITYIATLKASFDATWLAQSTVTLLTFSHPRL